VGLSGNLVKSEAVAAAADDWADRRKANQRRLIEAAEARLMNETIAEGDAAAADRHVRAITNLARAVAAVEAIKPCRAAKNEDRQEDEMGGRQDDDPRELEALRAQVLERYDVLRAKAGLRGQGGAGEASGDSADLSGPEPRSGTAPADAGDGLAHLADAGWTGSGQDVRGSLLAA
jgi:hypothetical protein